MNAKKILEFIEKRIAEDQNQISRYNELFSEAESEEQIVNMYRNKHESEIMIVAFREIAAFIKGEEY